VTVRYVVARRPVTRTVTVRAGRAGYAASVVVPRGASRVRATAQAVTARTT
jgi:hypothetical protein